MLGANKNAQNIRLSEDEDSHCWQDASLERAENNDLESD